MFIEFIVQGLENYGTEIEPYWKCKHSGEYLLPINPDEFDTAENKEEFLKGLADRATQKLNQNGTYWRQYVVDWRVVEMSHLTWLEQAQLEHDGYIRIRAEIIDLEDEPKKLAA